MIALAASLERSSLQLALRRLWRDRVRVGLGSLSLAVVLTLLAFTGTLCASLWLRPIAFADDEQLHALTLTAKHLGGMGAPSDAQASLHAAHAFAEQAADVTALESASEMGRHDQNAATEVIQVDRVASDFFAICRLPLAFGEVPRAEAHQAAVSARLARRWFGEPTRAIGQAIEVNGEWLEVRAVLPASYLRPAPLDGQRGEHATDVLVPVDFAARIEALARADRGGSLALIGRGSANTLQRQLAEQVERGPRLREFAPEARVMPLRQAILQDQDAFATTLFGLVLLLFLVALTSVAVSTANRFALRTHDHFVAHVLGANRYQQRLDRWIETGLLFAAMALASAVLATAASAALSADPRWRLASSGGTLGALVPVGSIALFVVAATLYMAPAIRQKLLARQVDVDSWRSRRSGALTGREASILKIALMTEMLVGCAALAIGGSLLSQSFVGLRQAAQGGFDGIHGVRLILDASATAGARDAAVAEMRQRLGSLRGVVRVARSNASPLDLAGANATITMNVEGRSVQYQLTVIAADPEWFAMLEYPSTFGHIYAADDTTAALVTPDAQLALVQSTAPRALEQMLAPPAEYFSAWNDTIQIRGAVLPRRLSTLGAIDHPHAFRPIVFRPYQDDLTDLISHREAWLVLQGTPTDPNALGQLLRDGPAAVLSSDAHDLSEEYHQRFREHLLAAGSATALAAAILVFLVIGAFNSTYSICMQQQQDYGVRLAIGAHPRQLRRELAVRQLRSPTVLLLTLISAAWLLVDDAVQLGPFRVQFIHVVAAAGVVFATLALGFLVALRSFERQSPMEALRA